MGSIITACTKKKAGTAEACISSHAPGVIDAVGSQWITALNATSRRVCAADLYQGGSHAESRRAAKVADYPHYIVSAGLGLISAKADVPNYKASVLAGEDDVLAVLSDGTDAGTWWRWLQSRSPFALSLASVIAASDGPCLIALPQAYLAMVKSEILSLPSPLLQRVRIFSGSPAPAVLADLQMPYDERLDGAKSPYKGTRSNFAARAVRHFANSVLPGHEAAGAKDHASAVKAAMAGWPHPVRTVGKRKTDAELREILTTHWDVMDGRSTRMLRMLRDDLGIACEQGRFAGLVRSLRAEREKVA